MTIFAFPFDEWSVLRREHSSVGLEHLPYKQRVGGSTPSAPTKSLAFTAGLFSYAPWCTTYVLTSWCLLPCLVLSSPSVIPGVPEGNFLVMGNCLCVSELLNVLAANGEQGESGSGWCTGSCAPPTCLVCLSPRCPGHVWGRFCSRLCLPTLSNGPSFSASRFVFGTPTNI